MAGPTSSIVSVSNGILFARGSEGGTGTIVALDASGTRGCGGTPKVCTPLWAYATTYSPKGFPVVSGTTLYVDTDQLVSVFPKLVEDGNIEAFDANGVKGCAGTPVVCAPIWSSVRIPSLRECHPWLVTAWPSFRVSMPSTHRV